jgi:protein TonB
MNGLGAVPMAFEAFLKQGGEPATPRWRRRLTYTLSLSLHVALLFVGAFQSFWRVDEISPRGVAVTFSLAMPAPPPPPPPAAKPAATPTKPRPVPRTKPDEVVQPRDQPPAEEPATASADESAAEGEAAGSEDGVAGGVIGGAAIEAPPPPPKVVVPAPVMLAPSVGVGQRLSDVNDPKFRPTLPPFLNRPGNTVRGLFKICVSTDGHVSDVKLLKSADPAVDQDWANVIRRWEYRPFTVNGHPTPFCHPLVLSVQSVN